MAGSAHSTVCSRLCASASEASAAASKDASAGEETTAAGHTSGGGPGRRETESAHSCKCSLSGV
jgi:hypothetical protein